MNDELDTTDEAGRTQSDTPMPVEGDDLPAVSVGDFFRRIYQVTYSKTIGLIIILVMAVFVLLGAVIGQAPAGTWSDPMSRELFLADARSRLGGWADILGALGLFHIFTSIGFYIVAGALGISLTGCTTHRIPQVWARFARPRVAVSQRFFAAARYHATLPVNDPPSALGLVATRLREQGHYRVKREGDFVYADRFAWGGFGTVVAHISFIIILVAFVVSGSSGYSAVVNLTIGGDPVPVAGHTSLTVQATDFQHTEDPDTNRPLDYVSHLKVFDGGRLVAEQDVRVNEPLDYGGWAFHQSSYGLSVDVHVTDTASNPVFSGTLPQQWTSDDGTLAIASFRLEDRGITINVVSLASGATRTDLMPGQVAFVVFADGEQDPRDQIIVDQGATGKSGDLVFGFDRESQYTGILVREDPGALWMLIGGCLLVVGMSVTFMFRQRRIWVGTGDGVLQFASSDKEDSGFRRLFNELITQAESWFHVRRK